ncbi:TetR/AcrR family transcriptional regulator [Kineococcus gynurae]|uniref:TetR/AcrR family transcriptional regulator n=1 Tax=Kineococcus gynurae TaxID=452979 RepID=A0ABV5LT41_9ACTN
MSRPPAAPARGATRERLLDAYEELICDQGPRAATLDAVASTAGVSKGGLLYHYGSKDALVEGQLARLRRLAGADLDLMRAAPEGAAAYYLNTSVDDLVPGLHRATVAAVRLAQDGEARAVTVFGEITEDWRAAIEEQVGDRRLSRVIQLIGDGMWLNATMGVPAEDAQELLASLRALGI